MDLALGTLFDRYRIDECIGEGGMGRVYRAYDTRLHRSVALKVLRSTQNAELDARLVREARAAAALNHPNVVSIFDVGESAEGGETLRYIAMELIEGRDLRSLAVDASIGQPLRLRWLADVARALATAHRAGLVHRDVKPENVMIRADGVVKVLDFGLARRAAGVPAANPEKPVPTLTERGVVIGTPVYMSPEQLRGDPLDPRSDQFAWGVMAYEVLSGALPWRNRTEPVHLIAEILAVDPPPLSQSKPEIPPTVAAAITRALSKSIEARLPSMDDVVEVLDSYLRAGSVLPISLLPPSKNAPLAFAPTVQSTRTSMAAAEAQARVSRLPRSRRRARVAVLATAAVTAVGAAFSFWPTHPAKTPAPPTSATPTAVTDLALPRDTRSDVAAEYRQAMQRLRFADVHGAAVHARSAIALDADFAPALLFLGIRFLRVSASEGRDLFRRAEEHSDRLSERDRALLDAYKPLIQGVPPDARETRVRLERLVARFPADAGLRAELADAESTMGDDAAAKVQLERARALDPGFGYAIATMANDEASLGDFESAVRDTEECARLAPSVPLCTNIRADVERQLGLCSALEERMRKAIAIEPTMPDWYAPLSEALFEEGRPLEAVRAAAQQGDDHATPAARVGLFLTYYPVVVDVLAGDFAKADEELRTAEGRPDVAQSFDAPVHAIPASLRLSIARETGRLKDAATIAETFFAHREVWSKDPSQDDYVMSKEVDPAFVHALRLAKRVDANEEERRRAAWIESWTKNAPLMRGYVWLKAYADEVETPEEATRALEALPRFEPLPRFAPDWAVDARVGRVRLLAGDAAGALPSLRRAAAACTAMAQPLEKVHALAALGEALERTGDSPGACGAYARVLSMWGDARPRSLTAERVRPRFVALRCGPLPGRR